MKNISFALAKEAKGQMTIDAKSIITDVPTKRVQVSPGVWRAIKDGPSISADIVVHVDVAGLAQALGLKALRNTKRKSRLQNGLIIIEAVNVRTNQEES